MNGLPRWIDGMWLVAFGAIGIVVSVLTLMSETEPVAVPLSMVGFVIGNRVIARWYTGRWSGVSEDVAPSDSS